MEILDIPVSERMNTVLYSWLATAAVSPFVTILSCWTLAIFRSYKSEWRMLDIFLLALTTLEGVSAVFSFGYSVLGIIRPALEGPCQFLVWGLTATRVFHLSTVTSLLLDRALSSRWTKAYRSNVRQSQIRYHIIVLGVVSAFVGVTTVFARTPSPPGRCSLHPLEWDIKFSALLTCVYGLLLLTGLACGLVVQAGRFKSRGVYSTSRIDSDCSGHCERAEWPVTASICAMSYAVNHLPYWVLNCWGLSQPEFWTAWMDNIVVWLQLVQGMLVPCILLLADMPHRSALRNMLRAPGRVYRHLSDLGGFRMQIGDTSHSKPGFPPFPAYRAAQRFRWSPTNLPSLQSLQPLDMDSLHKNYGSGGYTTLLTLPSSTTSFSSPYSTCSSTSQSVNSVTTNAVDDFVFRRPSILALFEPHPSKETLSPNSHKYEESINSRRRCDTPTPFVDSEETCSCTSSSSSKDIIGKNMINIILSYNDSSLMEKPLEDDLSYEKHDSAEMSSLTSTESSDVDSVQSVIIRQRVDQKGRVSESDISYAQRTIIKCVQHDSDEEDYSGRKIIYSEYL